MHNFLQSEQGGREMDKLSKAVRAAGLAVGLAAWPWQASEARAVRVIGGQPTPVVVMVDKAVTIESREPFVEVSIAQPDIADVSPLSDRALYVLGRSRGRTTLSLFAAGGRLIGAADIVVEPDIGEFKARLAALLPGEPIEARTAGGALVLSGMASGAAAVERAMALARAYFGDDVLNMMTVGGVQQVALRVRIAEINRGAARELGIGMSGSRTGNPAIAGGSGSLAGRTVVPPASVTPPITPPAASGFGAIEALIKVTDRVFLNVAIDALEEKGFARLLAEPNLTAVSGTEARFLAGGEVPVPQITDEGRIGVDYRQVGVSLNFVPTVLGDGLISIAVTAEVSDVDPSVGFSIAPNLPPIPGFRVRRATTMVELEDGQSFAIAGLYQNSFDNAVSQLPWVGDVPVLGALFRSTTFRRGETELVVIVSVDRVGPAPRGATLVTPADRVRLPTEAELFLLGRTESGPEDVWAQIGADLEGPFGYVVE